MPRTSRKLSSSDSISRVSAVRASLVDSYEGSSNFVRRMEQAWDRCAVSTVKEQDLEPIGHT
ncbi:hypothetical protein RJ641_006263 [Dillenia turbinata]|uniref:Uncharacterized protein n=1 Tax=Dillenia turbinata TaxID=194707 RepID=A0AAN8VHT7_9MAGN